MKGQITDPVLEKIENLKKSEADQKNLESKELIVEGTQSQIEKKRIEDIKSLDLERETLKKE